MSAIVSVPVTVEITMQDACTILSDFFSRYDQYIDGVSYDNFKKVYAEPGSHMVVGIDDLDIFDCINSVLDGGSVKFRVDGVPACLNERVLMQLLQNFVGAYGSGVLEPLPENKCFHLNRSYKCIVLFSQFIKESLKSVSY